MDREDRDLFERSVRAAFEADRPDAALAELGWEEALAAAPQDAIRVVFGVQGERCGRSRALVAVAGGEVFPFADVWVRFGDAPGGGLDPDLGLTAADAGSVDGERVRLARLALSSELVGLARGMLALAREHALGRVQFDQPIARFQAVRHKLAETLVAVEMAEAVVDGAWLDATPVTAAMAKALAGRSARTAARHCQQVCAGIGFTTEHPLHRYVRRTYALDELFGSARTLTEQLGDELLASRRLPPLLAL